MEYSPELNRSERTVRSFAKKILTFMRQKPQSDSIPSGVHSFDSSSGKKLFDAFHADDGGAEITYWDNSEETVPYK